MADMNEVQRKESNCVRCRNHGLKVTLRGHKQYCPYASCTCDKCKFTAEQQRQMRLQNAIRRAEANGSGGGNVAKRAREMSTPPTPQHLVVTSPQPQQPQQVLNAHQQQQQIVTVTVQSANAQNQANGISDEKKMLFDRSSELLKKLRYPWEMMPVMYALVKYANGNIEEVLQKIDEGQYAVNEQVRLQTLNLYIHQQQQQQQQQQQNLSNQVVATRECG